MGLRPRLHGRAVREADDQPKPRRSGWSESNLRFLAALRERALRTYALVYFEYNSTMSVSRRS